MCVFVRRSCALSSCEISLRQTKNIRLLNASPWTIFALRISYLLPILILRIMYYVLYSGINIYHRRLFTNLFKITCNFCWSFYIDKKNKRTYFPADLQNAKFRPGGELLRCYSEEKIIWMKTHIVVLCSLLYLMVWYTRTKVSGKSNASWRRRQNIPSKPFYLDTWSHDVHRNLLWLVTT